ncbi:MAG: hypothetical protein U9R19_13285, partial [Bacteroidota bacterium]|nr:hypothetical protein [Bacteroidota bacterium]
MKKIVLLTFTLLFGLIAANSYGQCKKNPKCLGSTKGKACDPSKKASVEKGEITVYYFHNTRRCATCNAVEDETKKALKKFYS